MNAPQAATIKFELTTPLTITMPALRDGERWAGVVTTEKGLHHVILLPGDQDGASWKKQIVWAEKAGGGLPDRQELALLRVMLPDEFQAEWYWSCEQHAASSASAWGQDVYDGYQDYDAVTAKLRARAVRRVAI